MKRTVKMMELINNNDLWITKRNIIACNDQLSLHSCVLRALNVFNDITSFSTERHHIRWTGSRAKYLLTLFIGGYLLRTSFSKWQLSAHSRGLPSWKHVTQLALQLATDPLASLAYVCQALLHRSPPSANRSKA